MQVIPVIDLKDGVVVHAKHGKRAEYLPINSALCPCADIFAVIDAYLALFDFPTFYIADLNALEQRGDHLDLLDKVAARFPERAFWLDAGVRALGHPRQANIKTVLGSESLPEGLAGLAETYRDDFILSLDYAGGERLGAPSVFTQAEQWPRNIIIMTLERVGSGAGPDLEKLRAFCRTYPDKNFIAAGGVRNQGDLQALQGIGIHQALLASALHSGAIGASELSALR